MIAAALGLTLSIGAHAEERTLPTQPGHALRLAQCSNHSRSKCWSKAPELQQFVDSRGNARSIRLQIAQSGPNLLVRARGLSQDQTIEIVVRRPKAMIPSDSQFVRAGPGITTHPLEAATHAATQLKMHVQLWDASTHTMHYWDPGSGSRPSEPIAFWKSATDTPPPSLTVHTNGEEWWIDTDSSEPIEIRHRRPILPSGGRGIGPPWSHSTAPNKRFPAPPHAGDYGISVRSETALSAAIVNWTPVVTPQLTALGIHPPPHTVNPISGGAFELTQATTICANASHQAGAAEWLESELARLTPFQVPNDCSDPTILFEADDNLGPEAYAIVSRSDAIRIRSSTASGARYGAIAAADLIGLDATAEAADIQDAPSIARRILFHEVSPQSGPMVRPEQTIEFIEHVVARARFNMLILELKGGLKYESHPELSRSDAWTRDDLARVIGTAEQHGITVIPSINSPAHANWITAAHPELMEESTQTLLCTRHPDTRKLLTNLYEELHELFGQPEFIHIGHDEVRWRTRWKHESQRCPRCASTPRWSLLADDLIWAHATLASLGTKPMMWSDMLVPGWHGSWNQMYRAARRIPEGIRPDFHVISWGRTGDSVGTLTPLGYAVIRGNTGYADWKRPGLHALSLGVAGEALALFNAAPWSSFQGTSGPTRDYHHWTNVALAGATAWNPAIETVPIDTSIDALREHPAYRPGLQHGSETRTIATLNASLTEGEVLRIDLEGDQFQRIALLQAADYDQSTLGALAKANRSERKWGGLTVGSATLEYADGSIAKLGPVRLGLHTEHHQRTGRGNLLFKTSRHERSGTELSYTVEWPNPHPDRPIKALRLRGEHLGIQWLLKGVQTASTRPTKN